MRFARTLPLFALVAAFAFGCQSSNDQTMTMQKKSLYERLGGKTAIEAVVADFVQRAASDPKVNFTRQGHANHWDATPANVDKLKMHLVQFISGATGGPKEYAGNDMTTVHTGMDISNGEFDAIAADLQATLDKFNVPAAEAGELMAIVGSTRSAIVGK